MEYTAFIKRKYGKDCFIMTAQKRKMIITKKELNEIICIVCKKKIGLMQLARHAKNSNNYYHFKCFKTY